MLYFATLFIPLLGIFKRLPLPEQAERGLESWADSLTEITQPLVVVGSSRALNKELELRAENYNHLAERLAELVSPAASERSLLPIAAQQGAELEKLVRGAGKKALNSWDRWHLIAAIRSRCDFVQARLHAIQIERSDVIDRRSAEFLPILVKAETCIVAVVLVLVGRAREWNPKSLGLLCRAADRYMLEVEDIFLAHHPDLLKRLETGLDVTDTLRRPTVSLDKEKQRIGLPG